jgi:stalled ribosome rescue protein Dom34
MRNQCGIWLNHREATIIKFQNGEISVDHVESDAERRSRSTGGVRGQRPFIHRSVNSAARADKKRHNAWQEHYAEILKCMPKSGEVLILGSGPAKKEFAGYLRDHNQSKIKIVAIEPTGRLTQKQLLAKVKSAFAAR